ncbi:hypothetical protein BX600DRAFT_441270 [Xylariales sp. PMI_506]|nr:hypothetical protein BX600DRAFT_441270 [Xylariales sp. PMI_506]
MAGGLSGQTAASDHPNKALPALSESVTCISQFGIPLQRRGKAQGYGNGGWKLHAPGATTTAPQGPAAVGKGDLFLALRRIFPNTTLIVRYREGVIMNRLESRPWADQQGSLHVVSICTISLMFHFPSADSCTQLNNIMPISYALSLMCLMSQLYIQLAADDKVKSTLAKALSISTPAKKTSPTWLEGRFLYQRSKK